jgi:triosephosphate isomerase (TIM)
MVERDNAIGRLIQRWKRFGCLKCVQGEEEMALRKLIVGNWKMNGALGVLAELDAMAAAASTHANVDIAICPPATLIAAAVARQPSLMIGAQDCHSAASGAHTGCLSAQMLAEVGAKMVIVGHSERRTDHHETDPDVQAKAVAAISQGLTAIICVGESEAQRDAGDAVKIVTGQLNGSVPIDADSARIVIAYEPVWAIGTGRTPSTADVAEMHAAIRARLIALLGESGQSVRILYGGSVKPSNAAELMAVADVDGALVGGASLKAVDFVPIIAAAAAV